MTGGVPAGLRRLLLTAHVACSVGWLGAVTAFLPLAAVGLTSTDPTVVRAVHVAAEFVASTVIVPLALAAVLTGVVSSFAGRWGLLQHYWVITKLVLTVVATIVLLLQLEPIRLLARGAATDGTEASLVVHATGGILVLLATTALAVYKPRGLTRRGQRLRRPSTGTACAP